jgi:hypothetical protein
VGASLSKRNMAAWKRYWEMVKEFRATGGARGDPRQASRVRESALRPHSWRHFDWPVVHARTGTRQNRRRKRKAAGILPVAGICRNQARHHGVRCLAGTGCELPPVPPSSKAPSPSSPERQPASANPWGSPRAPCSRAAASKPLPSPTKS